ncbi:MAG TPA: hypothetical protein VJ438_03020 [Candidatus Nanoarchaeia archaeon]|nr:hypothetical protein [Candidatus Nanoarchaeia archaeon]
MSFQVPTYLEYMKATKFARFKYKYGIVIMILCWICLLFICYYMVVNGEALASNPLVYGAEKYDVECYCSGPYVIGEQRLEFYVNSTTIKSSKG